jgi:hypothetical protein
MRYLKLLAGLIAVSVLCGCAAPKYAESPTCQTWSFNPSANMNRICAYNGEEYFYCDENGSDGSGIYKTKDGINSALLTGEYYHAYQMSANKEYIYLLDSSKFVEIDLLTGAAKEHDDTGAGLYYSEFAVDGNTVFVRVNKITPEINDWYYYKLTSGNGNWLPESAKIVMEKLRVQDARGNYAIRDDDQYSYIYNNDTESRYPGGGILGIRDKDTGRQVFRLMLIDSVVNGQSLLYFQDEKMIFANRQDGGSAFSMLDSGTYKEDFTILENRYLFDMRNIVYENGSIYALLQEQENGGNYWPYNAPQLLAVSDALVCVDVDTGDVTTLYEAESGEERIVGFANQKIYLFQVREASVDCLDIATGAREEFARFEGVDKHKSYAFEMCGRKLFVWGGDDQDPLDFVGAFDYLP